MMALKIFAAAVATILLSVVFLAYRISDGMGGMSVKNGDWVTSVSTGSEDADTMQKATVALGGLLASTRENSIYYVLNSVAGEPLRLNCRYRIEGKDYGANWWSITAYGWDNYLIPNTANRYSFNNENVIRRADGSWTITIAARNQPGNWLPVGPAGAPSWRKFTDYDFDLLLRLYTPSDDYLQAPHIAALPTVTQEACE